MFGNNPFAGSDPLVDDVKNFLSESSDINEGVADFMRAAAQAKKEGKDKFKFGGKEYDVTISKDDAKKIIKSDRESEGGKDDHPDEDGPVKMKESELNEAGFGGIPEFRLKQLPKKVQDIFKHNKSIIYKIRYSDMADGYAFYLKDFNPRIYERAKSVVRNPKRDVDFSLEGKYIVLHLYGVYDPVNEEQLDEAKTSIDTERYFNSHGKEPKGSGRWIIGSKKKVDLSKDKPGVDYYESERMEPLSKAIKNAKKELKRAPVLYIQP